MHPIAFKIGSFPIYFYGVMMVLAYLTVIIIMKYTHKIEGFTYDQAIDISIYSIVGGVLGARLLFVFLNMSKFMKDPLHIIFVREGGLSWHGGLMGGFVGMLLLHFFKKMPLGKICDYAAVHVTIALAVGRIGCFLNGCCYGKIANVPWAVEFTGANLAGHRHPTQIYESLMLVVCFVFMLYWWKNKKFDGEMTFLMFASYGLVRFIVEIFRDNTSNQYFWGIPISLAQYFSIILMVVFSVIIYFRRRSISASQKCVVDNK